MPANPPENSTPIFLEVKGLGHVPSKKNYHFPRPDGGLLIDKSVRLKMRRLENAILSALLSESQIIGKETHSECWKRLRTLLSGLCDDSIREIPEGKWRVEYVPKGQEGVEIGIVLI